MLYAVATGYGLAVLAGLLLLYGYLLAPREAVVRRLDGLAPAHGRGSARQEELSRPLFERAIRPLCARLLDLVRELPLAAGGRRLLRRLERAGRPGDLAPGEVLALKYAAGLFPGALGGVAAGTLGFPLSTVSMAALLPFIGGWLGVDAWLRARTARRRARIVADLPGALDLLTVSVEAGLGFEGALLKVAEKMPGPLAEEFARALAEIQMGKPRREALRDMAERADVEDVHTFVGAIVTGEQFGVGIAAVLREQAESLRHRRRYRAQEEAMKAPVKMLFPLIFLIFPALMVVLLGPAFVQLSSLIKK